MLAVLDHEIIVKLLVKEGEAMLIVLYHLQTLRLQILLQLIVEITSWIPTATTIVGIMQLLLLIGGATENCSLTTGIDIYFVHFS